MTERIESKHHLDNRPMPHQSLLDDWIAEVGEEQVIAVVEATLRGAGDGSIPSYTSREQILADWEARYPTR